MSNFTGRLIAISEERCPTDRTKLYRVMSDEDGRILDVCPEWWCDYHREPDTQQTLDFEVYNDYKKLV